MSVVIGKVFVLDDDRKHHHAVLVTEGQGHLGHYGRIRVQQLTAAYTSLRAFVQAAVNCCTHCKNTGGTHPPDVVDVYHHIKFCGGGK